MVCQISKILSVSIDTKGIFSVVNPRVQSNPWYLNLVFLWPTPSVFFYTFLSHHFPVLHFSFSFYFLVWSSSLFFSYLSFLFFLFQIPYLPPSFNILLVANFSTLLAKSS
ncbi:hypothetical protein ES332_A10G205700v1 [Gossypium tomentosum]|uniref:Uncharacterized protein n=1 Tax=Gossypium tomentosum TaxID=34277 RepID=A0A5D2NXR8_GOSTO|nr:hypothetical protein ES332_A10G205700v1 [Gossypium tomentosum]